MSTPKILIVDDEEGVRESLKLILGDYYDIILTDSGEQALRCLEKDPAIGLVLLDIKMPKVNGLEVLKAVKAKRHALSVVMVTGYRSVETAAEATRLGASGYIVKPFKSDEILATVQRCLASI
ncbi:MAG: hypothetical protein A3G91_01060 [Omnitrophica WOR_2 bacterium RIFCSPLOWO2_12_FULL_50_9]|nr:MAG: hypothetical protein A3D87_07765 [Omnitrophica WOR_2 bacterium RIFCSPHIGHO2_02_FULL_50_17]OGX42955.1 MAG: hypothetical protein A3G91_01060 [Omnitrophica WOR_2 bacterium RIFCSPLOWO2_12_FULL_50_9]